jgi:hypothetical protein
VRGVAVQVCTCLEISLHLLPACYCCFSVLSIQGATHTRSHLPKQFHSLYTAMADADEDVIPRTGPSADDIDLSDETQDFRFLAALS